MSILYFGATRAVQRDARIHGNHNPDFWRKYAGRDAMMDQCNRPTKEQVREWLLHRRTTREPLPDQEQIGLELWSRPVDGRKNGLNTAS